MVSPRTRAMSLGKADIPDNAEEAKGSLISRRITNKDAMISTCNGLICNAFHILKAGGPVCYLALLQDIYS
jgi:hypothetical protein